MSDIQFDVSRDFLDGIALSHPAAPKEGQAEIKANGQLHFLPSSPDGTMHTAVVAFALTLGDQEQAFARAGWRFLFTTSVAFDPNQNQQHQFFSSLLMVGAGKIMVALNTLCMHANLPLIPFEPSQMQVQRNQVAPVQQQAQQQ
jgi:hypothetical protein